MFDFSDRGNLPKNLKMKNLGTPIAFRSLIVTSMLLLCFGCSSDDEATDFSEANEQEILAYLSDRNLTAEKSQSGLYYIIEEQGSGESPITTSNVTVSYRGYFTDGQTFEESPVEGISFNLTQVIPGWTEGITYFNEGGSGTLLVPSSLAYGNTGRGPIPGGAVILFDIVLISVD